MTDDALSWVMKNAFDGADGERRSMRQMAIRTGSEKGR